MPAVSWDMIARLCVKLLYSHFRRLVPIDSCTRHPVTVDLHLLSIVTTHHGMEFFKYFIQVQSKLGPQYKEA